jgi:antitoxin MazE
MEFVMQTSVQKWGNSLAVRIPNEYIKEIKIHQGSPVEIKRDKNKITIIPIMKKTNKEKLHELLSKITKQNLHKEFDWGKRMGNEIW